MKTDERLVVDFLFRRGLSTKEFTKEEKTKSKTPDFRVFSDDILVFFCEVKSIERDDWLKKLVENAPPGVIVAEGGKDPRYNRISSKIHEASQQFNAVNPHQEYPNVLIFANHDRYCSWSDLISITTGNFFAEGGRTYPIYRKFSEGRIQEEKFQINLYIWIDDNNDERYLFNFYEKKHLENLCKFFDTDSSSIENLSELYQRRKK